MQNVQFSYTVTKDTFYRAMNALLILKSCTKPNKLLRLPFSSSATTMVIKNAALFTLMSLLKRISLSFSRNLRYRHKFFELRSLIF